MKKAINFVRGAVAKNDAVPILTHIHVYDGRVQTSNGKMCIDTPCEEFKGMNFTCKQKTFLLAIDNCDDEPELIVKADTLTVRSGKFKTSFKMLPEEYPLTEIDHSLIIKPNITILNVLRNLLPFVSDESKRPWAMGIFFNHEKAYATNAIVMAAMSVPDIGFFNLSADAATELIRINKEPVGVYSTENHLVFLYDDDSWIRANNLSTEWPDVSKFIPDEVNGTEVTANFIRDVERVGKFSPDTKVHFSEFGLRTTGDECTITDYDLPKSTFRVDIINSVLTVSDVIDLTKYPNPCPFMSADIKGVVIGMAN